MRMFFIALAAHCLAVSVATAAPINQGNIEFSNSSGKLLLHYSVSDIGGGLYRYDVSLDDPANQLTSYYADALGFTGVIYQDKGGFGGIPDRVAINDYDTALLYDGKSYDAARDSYFFVPFTDNMASPFVTDSPNTNEGAFQRTFTINAGTGGGSLYDTVQLGQIVASDISIVVSGRIARSGQYYNLDGNNIMWAPEPSSATLLVLGISCLAWHVRRRRQNCAN